MISDNAECVLISPCLELANTSSPTCDEIVDRVIEGLTGNLINCRCSVNFNSNMSHVDGQHFLSSSE